MACKQARSRRKGTLTDLLFDLAVETGPEKFLDWARKAKDGRLGESQVAQAWKLVKGDSATGGSRRPAHTKAPSDKGKAKGTGKGRGGTKCNTSKGSSPTGGKRGKVGDSDTKGRSASPTRIVETDLSKCCKSYLKGNCTNGKDCELHHNGSCKFFASGKFHKGRSVRRHSLERQESSGRRQA